MNNDPVTGSDTGGASACASRSSVTGGWFLLVVALLLAATALKTVHLGADPTSFINEIGYQIDEGYKTLAPRNLSLYDTTRWNAADQYSGWMTTSAMTQWPYYWAFEAFGTQLRSARLVSVLYATSLLVIAVAFLWRRHSAKLAVLGTLLLAADPGLFLFSRSALFETALALFTYAALFAAVSVPARIRPWQPILLVALTVPAFLFLKKSILIYIGPAVLALAVIAVRQQAAALLRYRGNRIAAVAVAGAALAGAALFFYYQASTLSPLDLAAVLRRPQKLLLNPVEALSPLALILGYTVLLELLLRKPQTVLEDGYRLALAFIIVIAPIGLAFFTYNYPRYYLPIIPAALLLVVERFSLSPFPGQLQFRLRTLSGALTVVVFLALAMTVWTTVNHYVIANLPIRLGADPGLSTPTLLTLYPLFLVLFAVGAWLFAARSRGRYNTRLIRALAVAHVLTGLAISIAAVTWPSYRVQAIQKRIVHYVAPTQSIGGDWAPYFVAGTALRVLYMRPDFNSATHIHAIRPDYFLNSNTPYDRKNLARLQADPDIALGAPIVVGEYAKHAVALYPIHYRDRGTSARPTG